VYGKEGIKDLALHNLAKADYAARQLSSGHDAKLLFTGAPRFHEFVLQTAVTAEELNAQLLEQKIIGGLSLAKWYPELGNATLWCATELNSKEQIDHAASVVAQATTQDAQQLTRA
jgi:glycine dehydrogenase subunit 1